MRNIAEMKDPEQKAEKYFKTQNDKQRDKNMKKARSKKEKYENYYEVCDFEADIGEKGK